MIIEELIAILGFDIKDQAKLKTFKDGLESVSKTAAKASKEIGKYSAIAGAAIAAGTGLLGRSIIKVSADFEGLRVQMGAIEGDSAKAEKAFEWIRHFGQNTSLSMAEAAKAYIQLKNFGLDPTDGTLLALADNAALMNQGLDSVLTTSLALGRAWTMGRLQGQELNMLIDQGVPVYQMLTDITGQSEEALRKLIAAGKIGRTEIRALIDAIGTRAAGASERMSKTWAGVLDRLGDTWENFANMVGSAGFFEETKNKAEELLATFDRWDKDGTMKKVAEQVSKAFTSIANMIGPVIDRIIHHTAYLMEHWDRLSVYVKAVAVAFGLMVARAFPVATVLGLIAFAIEDLFTYLQGGESLIGDFVNKIGDIFGVSGGAAKAIAGITAAVASLVSAFAIFKPAQSFLLVIKGLAASLTTIAPLLAKGLLGPAGWALAMATLINYIVDKFFGINLFDVGVKWGKSLLDGIWQSIKGISGKLFGGNNTPAAALSPDIMAGFSRIDQLDGYKLRVAPGSTSTSNSNVNVTVQGVNVTNNGTGMTQAQAAGIGQTVGNNIANSIPPTRVVQGGF